jgi:cyclophilin family peptidyl-prolyl cis-trans isomerase
VQTGDPTGTGTGGQSYWGTPFRDEYDLKGAARHDSRGVVAMANKGANTNGSVLLAFTLRGIICEPLQIAVLYHIQDHPQS